MGKGGCKAVSTCKVFKVETIYFFVQKTVILLRCPDFYPLEDLVHLSHFSNLSYKFQYSPIVQNIICR